MKRLVLSATTASAIALAGLYAMGVHNPLPAHAGVTIPAPASDVAVRGSSATAVIAGGCFWGIEGVFENVAGVRIVTAGYAGGSAAAANYGAVGGGRSGHAEAVRIVYDPRVVSYGQLLHIFFSVAHDPTQLNRQGPDQGSQYRSAIFPQNGEQRRVAQAYVAQLGRSGRFGRAIVTRIESGGFWPAEDYHQNYMRRNPRSPYIMAHDAPKLRDLRATFPRLVSARPAA
jgi:peptide-methionine (S)-S-oxide reductase